MIKVCHKTTEHGKHMRKYLNLKKPSLLPYVIIQTAIVIVQPGIQGEQKRKETPHDEQQSLLM